MRGPYIWPVEAEGVFENLEWMRVTIRLDDRERRQAIDDIKKVVKKFKECFKPLVVSEILYAVLKELFKSTVVDDELMARVIESAPCCPSFEEDEEKQEPIESEDEDHKDNDDEVNWEELVDPDEFKLVDDDDASDDDVRNAEEEMLEYEEAGIKELNEQCRKMGCSLRQEEEHQILRRLVSWFCERGLTFYIDEHMKDNIELVMEQVRYYIARSCTLDDLQTVSAALLNVESDFKSGNYEIDEVAEMDEEDQLLTKNTVPSNEEGITSLVNQFKQDQRSSGVECETVTPMNQAEGEQIFPTTPEQMEVCGSVVSPLKAEQEEENAVNVDICPKPECASQTRKRKLEELS